ncbi:MAG: hypothetical protein EAZ43_11520 [Betaproteobacteria bacterium]|nr:MAG: hypothetical protein EAZ43_11520 [Betaproteobacteria bacterium]
MNLLNLLASGPTTFHGEGINHEQEKFTGALNVQPLEGGIAVLLSYTATLKTGAVVHSESTLLGVGADGKLCLWPVMSELPVVLPHTEVTSKTEPGRYTLAVFASGPRDDDTAFREEITIQINEEGSIVYSHAWGLPGGQFAERSSCTMKPNSA